MGSAMASVGQIHYGRTSCPEAEVIPHEQSLPVREYRDTLRRHLTQRLDAGAFQDPSFTWTDGSLGRAARTARKNCEQRIAYDAIKGREKQPRDDTLIGVSSPIGPCRGSGSNKWRGVFWVQGCQRL
jgi:hypothetical protein